jgi:hypothetical protein
MDFKIVFTDKEISAWGGMIYLKRLMEKSGILNFLSGLDLPSQGSNRGYSPLQLIQSFWLSVWCGANRFMHLEVLRVDETLKKLFGWKRMAGHKSFQRYFEKFTLASSQNIFHSTYQWFFNQLQFDNYTLDLDSTVLTRYGRQQGAARGHNSKKPGRKRHHPLMAFVADCRMVANFWLRDGSASTTSNFEAFLLDTLDRLKNKTIGLLRADSGFYDKAVFQLLESRSIQYIIAAQMYPILQKTIIAVPQSTWLPVAKGIDVTSVQYQSPLWNCSRRIVVVRQKIEDRPEATGVILKLFKEDEIIKGFRYSAFVTNLTLPNKEIWLLYRNRADAENRIKELKEDFALDSFCMNKFEATETALNWVMLAYNLMSLFRIAILKSNVQPQLKTLRYKLFAVPSYITKNGSQHVLNMTVAMKRRRWFEGLFSELDDFKTPYVVNN